MSKRKAFIIVIIAVVVIFGGTFAWDILRSYFIKQFFANYKQPPVTISATRVTSKTWNPVLTAVGSLVAVNGVAVSAEVSGQVRNIFFKSGQYVQKGDPLVQLDDAIDQQTLVNNLAQANLNQLNYDRQLALLRRNATSQSAVDKAKAELEQANAAVATARVNVQKKRIVAPFSGKLGIRQVNLGEYVQPGQVLVSLQSLKPLFADFSLPGQYTHLLRDGQKVVVRVSPYPTEVFNGQISAINSTVDVNTRTISVRAIIPNEQLKLYPGLFASIDVVLPREKNVVTIPQTSVSYSLYGDTVYVITQKGKDKKGKPILIANQRFVELGDRKGNVVAVKEGVKPGETVVTSGQLKLRNGIEVVINNTVNPSN